MALITNLASYYPLTADANDVVGTTNGTATNVTFATSGGKTYSVFNGSSSKIDLGAGAFNFGTGDLTVSGWIYFITIPSGSSSAWILGRGVTSATTPAYSGFGLAGYSSTAYWYTGGGGAYSNATDTITTGQWYHMVGTRSGTTTKLYIDGALVSTVTTPSVYDVDNALNAAIGAIYTTGWFTPTDGYIWDTAVWSRELSAAEVTEIYNAGNANNPLSTLLPALGAVVPDITGAPGVPATFDGSASTSVAYYRWSWPGVPTPFPDNGAVTPIDMTDNEGLWHFEGNANDTSGNARNGTVTGASLVTGKVGSQAYQFGAADYISFGAASTFISANFSISFWLKGDAAWTPTIYNAVLGATNATSWSQGFGIYWGSATTIRCFVGAYGTFASLPVVAADWNHIVMTWDGSDIKAYLNGSLISTTAQPAMVLGANTFDASRLGTLAGGQQTIDELAIWSRVISASEVSGIYAAQNVGPLLVPSGSAVDNAPIPFPDNGAATPLNMTDNEGLWHFDNNANDTSGTGNNATVSGTSYVAGKVGTHAVDFSSGDYVEVPNDTSLNSATGTVSFWIKTSTSTAGSTASLISKNKALNSANGWHIYLDSNQIAAQIKDVFAATSTVKAGPVLNDGAWHHIVLVFVSGSPSYIYVDGALNSTSAWPWISYTVTTTDPMRMGVNVDGWWGNYVGAMDEVALWSRALSAAEVADIYAAQSGTLAGIGTPTFTFTPDIVGTYTVNLAVNATTNANADCVVTTPASGGGGPPGQGGNSQGGSLQGGSLEGNF
jgi:hypothetical protein